MIGHAAGIVAGKNFFIRAFSLLHSKPATPSSYNRCSMKSCRRSVASPEILPEITNFTFSILYSNLSVLYSICSMISGRRYEFKATRRFKTT